MQSKTKMHGFNTMNWPHVAILLLTLFAILDAPHFSTSAAKAPPAVVISKCCRIGQRLDSNQECVAGRPEHWWPLILLMLKQTYFQPHGDAPRFFKIRQNFRPACSNIEMHPGSSHALFSNGSLYLSERHSHLDPGSYCIDDDVAVVCLPEVSNFESRAEPIRLSKVKKCCGAQAIYSAETSKCTIDNGDEMTRRLVINSSAVNIVYGLPKCRDGEFTIDSVFRESNLNYTTGSLVLDSGRQVTWNEYCLEHTISNTHTPYVSVFTCTETAVTIAPKTVSVKVILPTFLLDSLLYYH